MWTPLIRSESRRQTITFNRDGGVVTVTDVIEGWKDSPEIRAAFAAALRSSPYDAFRWEMPALTTAKLTDRFECVLLDSPGLAPTPEPNAFAEHFPGDGAVVAFTNLGGDATLVAPCPLAAPEVYRHLAAFLRGAPENQIHALWQTVAEQVSLRIGTKPFWLSTAGAGVSWLHVRLDARPKYFGHLPYRDPLYQPNDSARAT